MNNGLITTTSCTLPERDRKLQYNKQLGMRMSRLLIGTEHEDKALRMQSCATHLTYQVKQHITTGEIKQDLQAMHTCKVRVDPVCTWARSRIWRKRLDEGLNRMMVDHPTTRFIFLTLTKKTCDVTLLGENITLTSKSFDRLMKRRDVKTNVLGYAKSLEITRCFDWYDSRGKFIERHGTTWFKRHKSKSKGKWKAKPTDECHPHIHVLLAVKASYFSHGYITQNEWVNYWKESLDIDYKPTVDIRTVKPNPKYENDKLGLISSVLELAKYSTKPCDIVFDQYFLVQFINQIHGTKHIVTGGLIKKYINASEPSEEDILKASANVTEQDEWIDIDTIYFDFDEHKNAYQERRVI